jgi:hypothetical protein
VRKSLNGVENPKKFLTKDRVAGDGSRLEKNMQK